jgi:hypothetical protein
VSLGHKGHPAKEALTGFLGRRASGANPVNGARRGTLALTAPLVLSVRPASGGFLVPQVLTACPASAALLALPALPESVELTVLRALRGRKVNGGQKVLPANCRSPRHGRMASTTRAPSLSISGRRIRPRRTRRKSLDMQIGCVLQLLGVMV